MDASAIELRHLRHFLALAESLHFGRAAAAVGIAQPPFSQSIARLEKLVGHPLFERRRSGVERVALTDAGRALLGPARQVVAQAAQAIETARAAGQGELGTLGLGFVASLAAGELPALLARFRLARPGVTLTISEMTTDPMLAALHRHEIELGLGREVAAQSNVQTRLLFRERLHLVAAGGHPLAGRVAGVADLAGQPFVLPPVSAGGSFRQHLSELCAASGFIPQVVQEATEWSTVLAFVGAGFGLSIVPQSALSGSRAECTVLDIPGLEWWTSVFACWRADHDSAVRDALLETLGELGRDDFS
ncbi:LysR substrate-binding domain-containing protein [Deinococcus sp.]|uniref:LysR substrate-binding domain-containing protein n=1 Tax=Deinococcus sp. TaxID=47478 RepID=UPI003C7DA707